MTTPPPQIPGQVEQALAERRPGEVLDEHEVLALMRGCSTRAPTGVRNRALIAVMWRTVCVSVKRSRLRPVTSMAGRAPSSCVVPRARPPAATLRSRRARSASTPTTLERVEWWRQRRARLDLPPRAPLFCTLRGHPLDQAYVRRLLRRLAAKPARRAQPGEDPAAIPVAVDRRVHPHALRHSFAHDAYRSGFDVSEVQQALGHRHTRTTYQYLRQLAPDVVELMRQRRWSDTDDTSDSSVRGRRRLGDVGSEGAGGAALPAAVSHQLRGAGDGRAGCAWTQPLRPPTA